MDNDLPSSLDNLTRSFGSGDGTVRALDGVSLAF